MAFKDWSQTAADNDDSDATINWLEGMSPASVNNSARAMMAALSSWRDLIDYGTVSGGTVGGSANAVTLTNNPTVTAREAGRRYLFKYTSTGTTGAVTLVVDGLTSGAIQYLGAALVPGDIATDDWVLVGDDGTNFQLLTTPRVSYLKLINGLTADASPVGSTDYWVTYDASASLPKRVLLNALAATQAQQATGASNDVYTTPGRQHFHESSVKAWLNYTHDTPAVNDSYGVTSVDDDGAGLFGVNFSVTFNNDDYTFGGSARAAVSTAMLHVSPNTGAAKSATAMDLRTARAATDALSDSPEVAVSFSGTLA